VQPEGLLNGLAALVYKGRHNDVAELTASALSTGLDPNEILTKGLMAGMDRVGHDFKEGEIFVPEVLVAARAMKAGLAVLQPHWTTGSISDSGTFVIGTVEGDLHDIGKNIVKIMLEGAGFDVVDLGMDVPADTFVEGIRDHDADFVGMSSLLTSTMVVMKTTIDAIQKAGLRRAVKIMVGGAPVSAAFARHIGADGYAPDAGTAVDVARKLRRVDDNLSTKENTDPE
jgi:5-methyltetrahydrofolate--homocysteine methyltransferase